MDEEANRLRLTEAFWRLAQAVFRGVMTDVVYWVNDNGTARIVFVGNPLKVAQIFGLLNPGDEGQAYYNRRIGDAIRHEMQVPLRDDDIRAYWSGPLYGLFDTLDRLGGQTAWQWSEAHDAPLGDGGVRVGFIPEPGYPWPAEGGRYWSAKKQRWLKSEQPGWLIEVEDRDAVGQVRPGVNPCLVFPADETKTEKGGPVCGMMEKLPWPIMATHAMRLDDSTGDYKHHKQLDQAIASIKSCGGFLFPSFAVGPIPATNFGPIVLVAHLELILDSLLPYRRGSRRRPCWVYGTDAWTVTTGQLMRDTSVELFSELHGDEDWQGNYIATLGVPAVSKQVFGEYVDPLKSTKELRTSLKRRMQFWTPDMSEAEYDEASRNPPERDAKYGYVEAKAREVVTLDEFPFLIAPAHEKESVRAFVRGVGYKGKVVFDKAEMFTGNEVTDGWEAYLWAWRVAEIVAELKPVVEIQT